MNNNIKALREEKGKSMKDVANDLGLAYTTYVNYEKGTRKPPTETLKALSEYFGCSADYILGIKNKRLAVSELAEAVFAGCGTPTPNQEDLQQQLEEVLKNNILETSDEKQKSPSDVDELMSRPDIKKLLELYRALAPGEQRKALSVLQALKETE